MPSDGLKLGECPWTCFCCPMDGDTPYSITQEMLPALEGLIEAGDTNAP